MTDYLSAAADAANTDIAALLETAAAEQEKLRDEIQAYRRNARCRYTEGLESDLAQAKTQLAASAARERELRDENERQALRLIRMGSARGFVRFTISGEEREHCFACHAGLDDEETLRTHLKRWLPDAELVSYEIVPDHAYRRGWNDAKTAGAERERELREAASDVMELGVTYAAVRWMDARNRLRALLAASEEQPTCPEPKTA